MFARNGVLSLVLPLLISQGVGAIQLDVKSQESIKSVAKTLAGGIVEAYKETLAEDRVPGLFSEPYYWWEAGTVFNGLIEYSHLTGDTQYNALISQALQHQLGDYNAFMPPNQTKTLGNDDQSSWGLAAMNAAEVGFPKPNGTEWVDIAANVFNTQAVRYDIEEKAGTCGGGLRWQIFTFNAGYSYKNAASNGNFFLLAARLAKFTGNATYSQYADKVYKWSKAAKLVTDDYRVYDGTDANTNCSSTQKLLWTATHGAYTEGAALMYNITGNQTWKNAVTGFVDATSIFAGNSSSNSSNNSAVIVEVACERNGKCNTDQRAYKGMFARSMARAALVAPIVSEEIKRMLSASAVAAAAACTDGSDPECKLGWTEATSKWEANSAKDGNLGEIFNAMEVVQVLLYPGAKALVSASGAGNGTQGGKPSPTNSGAPPQNTNAAGSVGVSFGILMAGVVAALVAL